MTRAELARILNTTRTTIGYAVQELIDAGIVRNSPDTVENGSRGRPGTAVCLAPDGAYFIGVEISVERVTIVLADFVLETLGMAEEPIDVYKDGPDTVLPMVLRHVHNLIRAFGLALEDIYGMGISIAGIVTPQGRAFLPACALWLDVPLVERLAGKLPHSWMIRCCNDASAFALRLVDLLEEADKQDLLVVLLETGGIGSAHVRNGVVDKGAHGMAGEIGHFSFDERVTDEARYFQMIAARYLAEAQMPSAGNEPLRRWGELVAAGIVNTIYVLDPSNVIVTGPLAKQYLLIETHVKEALVHRSRLGFETPAVSVRISDRTTAAMGAAALVRQDFFKMPTLVEDAKGR